jgi:hypothetical protein
MQLTLGFGPGTRLLAPGAPDWIGADGTRVGWVIRDKLFLREGDQVRIVDLPDLVEDVVATTDGWVAALGTGFVRVDPERACIDLALVDDEAEPVTTRPGYHYGLFVEVPEHRLLKLDDGEPVDLPDAALRARHLRPWARGAGACWVDFDILYRLGERVSAIGKAPGAEGIACGPDGAVAVALKADTVVAAPRGLAMRVGRRLDMASARFSTDGAKMLAADEEGVVLVDLATGGIDRTWEGSLAPVGWAPDILLWDAERGAVLDAEGAVWLDGFAGSVAAAAGPLVCGPGGAVWDTTTGTRRGTPRAGGVFATDGERVVFADDTNITTPGGAIVAHGLVSGDDTLAAARFEGDALVLTTTDGETGRFAVADGAPLKRGRVRKAMPPALPKAVRLGPDNEPSRVTIGEATWPLPVDGAVQVGGAWWLWNDEGMLVVIG